MKYTCNGNAAAKKGPNCRFLQGTIDCESKTREVQNALVNGEDVLVYILNYTAGGTLW